MPWEVEARFSSGGVVVVQEEEFIMYGDWR
jgi:hypothetical protein